MKKNKIISFREFPKDPEKIAKKLGLSETELIEEEKQLMKDLQKKGYKSFIFAIKKSGVKAKPGNQGEKFIKQNLRKLALEKKFVKDQAEFNQLFTKVNSELTKLKIKKAVKRDNLILQTNGAIEEVDKSINIFVERLREWYGLHFPEMNKIISNHEKFVEIVKKYGPRRDITEGDLAEFKEKSMGAELKEEDIKIIQSLAGRIRELYDLRKKLTKYLEKLLKEVIPNFSELAGPIIAAKLISKAGSLERLAKMPSSTVQLLGAEKALFRFLHGRGKSPKFGILFAHPLIQNSPDKLRGRVARALASKLSIAAKMDCYSKKYKADKLKKELKERVKEILSSK
jgi:nucleolar protein 56